MVTLILKKTLTMKHNLMCLFNINSNMPLLVTHTGYVYKVDRDFPKNLYSYDTYSYREKVKFSEM